MTLAFAALKSHCSTFDSVHCTAMFKAMSRRRSDLTDKVTLASLREFFVFAFECTESRWHVGLHR